MPLTVTVGSAYTSVVSAGESRQPEKAPENLDAISVPGVLVRRPRLVRVITTGVLGGAALGVLAALGLPGEGANHRTVVALLLALGFGVIGGLVAGAIATRPTASTNSARVGAVMGFMMAIVLVAGFMIGEEFFRSYEALRTFFSDPILVIIAMAVLAGLPFLGQVIGASFDRERPAGIEKNETS